MWSLRSMPACHRLRGWAVAPAGAPRQHAIRFLPPPMARASTGAIPRHSAARGTFGRHASPIVRHEPPPESGRSATPVPRATPASTAIRGSSVTPSPPATICTSVCRLVAANPSSRCPLAAEQAARRQRLIAQAVPLLQQQQPLAELSARSGTRAGRRADGPAAARPGTDRAAPAASWRRGSRRVGPAAARRAGLWPGDPAAGRSCPRADRAASAGMPPAAPASAAAAGTARWSGSRRAAAARSLAPVPRPPPPPPPPARSARRGRARRSPAPAA